MRLTDARAAQRNQATAQRSPDFVRNAFNADRRNARYVSMVRCTPTKRGWRTATVTKIRGERARVHFQRMHPPAGFAGTFRTCRGIQIDCDCKRHLFVWNYALFQEYLAVLDRTNGDPPVETNPEQRLGCCKHLVIALRYMWNENFRYPHVAASDDPSPRGSRPSARHPNGSNTRSGGTVRLTSMRTARRR